MAIDFSALEQIGANLQRIVSGQNHVVAITEEGALYVWGRNDMGQLGLGVRNAEDTTLRFVPTLLELYNGNGQKQPVIDVALGLEHTVAVVKGGRVFVWGSNRWGQLGIDQDPDVVPWTSIPTPIDIGGESIRNVSSAGGHNAALTFGGAVYTWGANNEGQLGQSGCIREDGIGNDPCLNYVKKPTKIFKTNENRFMPQMKLIAVGGHFAGEAADGSLVLDGGHTLAVTNDNVLYGWGDNFHGQIGTFPRPGSRAPGPEDLDFFFLLSHQLEEQKNFSSKAKFRKIKHRGNFF
jgi:alpha-tubulin suppressor-like RCC1 family protein